MITPDKIVRSSRKTLCVSIDAFARVTVRAPKRCTDEQIAAFLKDKASWITRKRAQIQKTEIALPPKDLDGYSLLLLGKTYTLRLYDGTGIRLDEPNSTLYLPRQNAKERLVKWLKENALRIFETVTKKTASNMNAAYKEVRVSSARTRWGTCSADNRLKFTFRLLYAPKEIIEYVVVHELAHTRHKNHSAAFWAEVEKYLPDWRAKRKWLKEHGILMQIF